MSEPVQLIEYKLDARYKFKATLTLGQKYIEKRSERTLKTLTKTVEVETSVLRVSFADGKSSVFAVDEKDKMLPITERATLTPDLLVEMTELKIITVTVDAPPEKPEKPKKTKAPAQDSDDPFES
ncbi:hypothetical protein [Deinococcus soli (ex Cha et al. 2016)]|uniref:Uncharacterized protein n=2 Tax=Deinococcus soli (ex Cha et al. 2016) TaxID=1309411 RepID=A0ACC6KGZ9_9DEIO|nr:hypothetical protein [Deinococcus soli (ex Cha et al. 2016)]MDR6218946.1 hypothetical protein [Deinococcus soli (ex Cha et al. 2016)]MDR6328743.1 hypothetical protein [Deinococcus soli (ex Cha et al. 2016)]MDR6751770.1 hypothetical protein [Deinococcus soli (ex Cha et al. 2016)]